jgi:hypothetical protein
VIVPTNKHVWPDLQDAAGIDGIAATGSTPVRGTSHKLRKFVFKQMQELLPGP